MIDAKTATTPDTIVNELLEFYRLNPDYQTPVPLMFTLLNLLHQEFRKYMSYPKRLVMELEQADMDCTLREIMKRKNQSWIG